jgi:hypothetical protein
MLRTIILALLLCTTAQATELDDTTVHIRQGVRFGSLEPPYETPHSSVPHDFGSHDTSQPMPFVLYLPNQWGALWDHHHVTVTSDTITFTLYGGGFCCTSPEYGPENFNGYLFDFADVEIANVELVSYTPPADPAFVPTVAWDGGEIRLNMWGVSLHSANPPRYNANVIVMRVATVPEPGCLAWLIWLPLAGTFLRYRRQATTS